jgi:hypothetical protein
MRLPNFSDARFATNIVRVSRSATQQPTKKQRPIDLALSEEARPEASRKLSDKAAALLVATAYSNPPEGRKRWTLDLLTSATVRLTEHEELSRETVRRMI